jgi:hypothetical protein
MSLQVAAGRTLARLGLYSILAVCTVIAVWIASTVPNADWFGTFDAAARGVFHGHSPYEQPLYSNPPWAVLILLPFVVLRPALARGLVLVLSLLALTYTAWRLRAPRIAFIALLLSPTAIGSLLAANLDAFAMLGIFLPPACGLLALMIKPQIGAGVVIFYLFQSWREHKLIGVFRTFWPILLATGLSVLLFPVWISRLLSSPEIVWNRSVFPFGVPVGLFLLWQGYRRSNKFLALASTPFLSPYLTFYTYLVVQIGLLDPDVEKVVRREVLQIILCAFLWVIMLAFRL